MYPKNRRLLNWALELSEYSYEVQHIRSKNNGISDCLSRLHHINVLLSSFELALDHNDLKSLQSGDPELFAAMNYLASARRHFDVNLLGSLKRHRKQLSFSPDGLLLWKKLIVVPSQLCSTVLHLSHDHPSSGHFGINRTWSRLSAHYFWPNAKQDVTNWVQSCLACNVHNPPPKGYHTDCLQPIYSSDHFELVCYDLAGPFMPSSSHGNIYALILVDHFTKWPEVLPLPDSKATTIAHAIYHHWICRYGLMQRLHSDGAQNVDGCVIHELCLILGIGKSKSSCLHPQGDGLSEAIVKSVKSCVQKHVDTTGKDWDPHLQSSVYAIHTSLTAAALTPQLDKVLALTQQLADQTKITNAKLDHHQQKINFLKQWSRVSNPVSRNTLTPREKIGISTYSPLSMLYVHP